METEVRGGPATTDTEVVYVAPLKGAVRAIKVFSLTTAMAAFFGGPVLVWLGNPSVPLVGRVMMSTIVMLAGLGTTALLHWLVKGMLQELPQGCGLNAQYESHGRLVWVA